MTHFERRPGTLFSCMETTKDFPLRPAPPPPPSAVGISDGGSRQQRLSDEGTDQIRAEIHCKGAGRPRRGSPGTGQVGGSSGCRRPHGAARPSAQPPVPRAAHHPRNCPTARPYAARALAFAIRPVKNSKYLPTAAGPDDSPAADDLSSPPPARTAASSDHDPLSPTSDRRASSSSETRAPRSAARARESPRSTATP